jgi:hypothetical protein
LPGEAGCGIAIELDDQHLAWVERYSAVVV